MSQISQGALVQAITLMRAMDLKKKVQLTDEIYRAQPHVLTAFLVQSRLGVSFVKMDFLLDLLLICFQAMKASKLSWPLFTEDDILQHRTRLIASIQFNADLAADLHQQAVQQYIDAHPEKYLFAFVQSELDRWLKTVTPEESDNFVVTTAMSLVNCIAFVPVPEQTDAKTGLPGQ